ncbi:hypothetical protein [Tenacibaculum maritimum]|uniref:hypothetical protein n=1 Tax=Tenacibaculum maritimum TaxID=107401 RepID=UPI003876C2BA
MLKHRPKTELEEDINEVLNIEFCSHNYSNSKKKIPHLEYKVCILYKSDDADE